MNERKQKSPTLSNHILPVSATMIGVCVTVITLFKVTQLHRRTYVDELMGFDTLFFSVSCLLSYISIRIKQQNKLERIADLLFMVGLLIMVVIGLIILKFE